MNLVLNKPITVNFKGLTNPPTEEMKAGAGNNNYLEEIKSIREADYVEDGSIFNLIGNVLNGITNALREPEITNNATKVKEGLDLIG
ncbi:MAG: hypothetical protein WCK67_06575 [bacterium]